MSSTVRVLRHAVLQHSLLLDGRLANRYLASGRLEAAVEKKRTSYDELFVEGRKNLLNLGSLKPKTCTQTRL